MLCSYCDKPTDGGQCRTSGCNYASRGLPALSLAQKGTDPEAHRLHVIEWQTNKGSVPFALRNRLALTSKQAKRVSKKLMATCRARG